MPGTLRRIFGPTRVDSATGGGRVYVLPATAGGGSAKVVQYQVVVIEVSDLSTMQFNFTLKHGPNGQNFVTHSTSGATTISGTSPFVVSWDANQAIALGEWLQLTLAVVNSTAQWLQIEVWELRKPF